MRLESHQRRKVAGAYCYTSSCRQNKQTLTSIIRKYYVGVCTWPRLIVASYCTFAGNRGAAPALSTLRFMISKL